MDCACYFAIHSPESTLRVSTGVCLPIPRPVRQRDQFIQRFSSLQHLRNAQNSGILWYLSLFPSEAIEILISLPPDERNLNWGICHTLIFVISFRLFIKDKIDTQSSHLFF